MAKPYQKAPRYRARIRAASKTKAVSVHDMRNHRSEPDRIAVNQNPRKRTRAMRPAIESRSRIGDPLFSLIPGSPALGLASLRPPVRVISNPGATLTIRRKSLFDVHNSIDPSGIFTVYTSDTCKVHTLPVVRRSWFGRSPFPKIPRRTLGRTTLDLARACRDAEGRGGPPGRPPLFAPLTAVSSVVSWPGIVGSY